MRKLVLIAFVLLVAPAGAATVPSGLHGVVTRGPITPVCAAGEPCTEPAKNVLLVFSRNGRDIGRTRTDAAGRYRIKLPAGMYRVSRAALTTGIGRGLTPKTVRVWPGRFVRVDFSIDTGIR